MVTALVAQFKRFRVRMADETNERFYKTEWYKMEDFTDEDIKFYLDEMKKTYPNYELSIEYK